MHRHSTRLKGYDYSQAGAYFVTICTWQREPLFGEVVEGEMRLSAAGKIVQWEWQRLGEGFPAIRLDAFVVMPNHVHGIIMINNTVGATQAEQTRSISASETKSIPDISGTGGSPRRVPEGKFVGATQADQTRSISASEIQSILDNSGTGGSPRRVHIGATNMAFDSQPGGPGGAIRPEQNLIKQDDGESPDKASEDVGGSPVHGPKGPSAQSLGAMVAQWKSRVTKRIWKLPGMKGRPIWQRNYYEHIIRDDAGLRRIEDYIQNNPRRWPEDQLHPQASPNKFNQDR